MFSHFNKKHEEGYNQNISDCSQILGKMNRKILEENVPPMFSQCLSFSTATDYKNSEDKPENPFKIILK